MHGPMDIHTRVFHNIDVIDKTRAEVEGLAAEGVSLSLKDLLTLKSRFSKPCRTMNKFTCVMLLFKPEVGGKTMEIFRSDGTLHAGPRSDYTTFGRPLSECKVFA